ncbi:MAG TPA: tetratricopeptide repeat protein [Bacteroidales bacterium]|nr:tetratricopeptide repeat protein [Bacteroidales bacterium]HOU95021.1 tetratricopeptide repeat protein [Bacteroidales bacterium]HQG35722.1 tetratricopeptide repeat protein [Bacteroidales bacterium]HQG53369.1 tetratricopeptide repeat protein [Bacteroidales bacterium]HQJ19776.1 tetratricopeptide repeat protein [Bacteroidales bacterium]
MKRNFLIFILLISTTFAICGQTVTDYLLRAKACIESSKYDEAIKILTAVLSTETDYRYFVLRGDAYYASGKFTEAEKDYLSANALVKSSGDYGLSRIYALRGNVKNSLEHLNSNLNSNFRKKEKEIFLDTAFERIENTPEWRQFWKTERYSTAESKLQEVEYYLSAGKKNDAQQIAQELLKEYPSENIAIYAGALVDYSFERYKNVISAMTKVIMKEKDNPDYLELLAKSQMVAGNPAGASVTYSKMIDLEIPDARLYLRRAECYYRTGEYNKSMKDIEYFLDIYPSSREGLRMAGRTAVAMGDNLKGISFFSHNIELNPNDPECFTDRANAYFSAKSWELAEKDYGMALDLKPDLPEVWLNKGIALINLTRIEDACFDFRKAFELGNKQASSWISRYCIH